MVGIRTKRERQKAGASRDKTKSESERLLIYLREYMVAVLLHQLPLQSLNWVKRLRSDWGEVGGGKGGKREKRKKETRSFSCVDESTTTLPLQKASSGTELDLPQLREVVFVA